MSVFAAMSGALATIFSLEKSRKWIIRDGRSGISRSGSGAPMASGLKKSRGLRMVGTILTRQSICGGDIPCGMRRVLLAALVSLSRSPRRGPGPPDPTWPRRPSSTSPIAQVRYAVPHGAAARAAPRARRPHRPGLRGRRAPAPPAQARGRRARRRGQPPPARLAGARPGPASCSGRARRAPMRAPTVTQSTDVLAAAPRHRPAGLRPRAAGGRATCASPCAAGSAAARASARARRSSRRWPPPAGGPSTPPFLQAVAPPAAAGAVAPADRRARHARRPRAPRPRIVCPLPAPAVCPTRA